jgi:hypothetical protein
MSLERCCMTSAGCGRVELVERWNDTVVARSKLLFLERRCYDG